MTALAKLALGLCIVTLAAGIYLAALAWAAIVAVVEAAGFWMGVVIA